MQSLCAIAGLRKRPFKMTNKDQLKQSSDFCVAARCQVAELADNANHL